MSVQAAVPLPIQSPPTEHAAIVLPDGATAAVRNDALELRDRAGHLLVRYADGEAEIAAPSGDLKLTAPSGRVVVQAALDVEIDATRDICHRAGRTVEVDAARRTQRLELSPQRTHLAATRLHVDAKESRVATRSATVLAGAISTTAERISQRASHYELEATRLVEKARDTVREVAGLAQARLGRARTTVRDVFSLHANRSVLVSRQDTTIDGERILLG